MCAQYQITDAMCPDSQYFISLSLAIIVAVENNTDLYFRRILLRIILTYEPHLMCVQCKVTTGR